MHLLLKLNENAQTIGLWVEFENKGWD
jgi:hypothetical protein